MKRSWSLNACVSPLFDTRPTALASTRLSRTWRRGRRPVAAAELGIFGSGTGAVRIGGMTAAQPDDISCAATGLVLLNAAYDPALAAWLERDPQVRLPEATAAMHRRATRATIGPLPWPRILGTPPWGVARETRVPGVVYRHRPVDDTDDRLMDQVLDLIVSATTQQIPVPLYSGGDLRGGWARAMPRHLVLALPSTDRDRLRIYEPGRGRIEVIAADDLRARTTPHRALGGWTHLAWILVPLVR